VHAIRVLERASDFTASSLTEAAYDSYLPTFQDLIPILVRAWDDSPSGRFRARLAEPVEALRQWDFRWSVASVPTSLAVFWGEEVTRRVGDEARKAGLTPENYVAKNARGEQLLRALAVVCDRLSHDFGTWKVPWGDVNRYQRLTGDTVQHFNDAAPSIPVGFTSSRWGSLASFGARRFDGTRKIYGTTGNSFVAVVEFGDRVQAKAVTAGGESGDPASPHFSDQALRYSNGDLRDVYFYRSDLEKHIERQYHPGEELKGSGSWD
jgi:acyl-homoserine lactone acylase PvdQ